MTRLISKRLHVASFITIAALCAASLVSLGRSAGPEETSSRVQQRIDRLETVVQAAEGVRAVKTLHYSYAHYLDSGLWNDLSDLFTENASGQFPTGSVSGKQSLRKYFMDQAGRASLGLAEGQLNVHLELQPIVTLGADGKTAKAAWHEKAMTGQFGKAARWSGGIYENEYVFENGVWKISRIHFYEQYQGEFELFGDKAPPKWNIDYHFDSAHVGVTIPQSAMETRSSSIPYPAGQRLNKLAERVQRMNDETEVRNLQHSYGYYLDRKMWNDLGDIFADGGSLELDQRGVYVGRPRIVRALVEFYGQSPLRTGELFDHLNLSTVVTVAADGKTASARTQQLSMLGLNGEFARWEIGTYENEFVKQGNIWKVRAVHYYPRMQTDFDKGWANDAKPAATVSKTLPPDRKPSQPYQSFPAFNIVGFHFANPVTQRPAQYPTVPVARVPVVNASRNFGNGSIDSVRIESTLTDVERKVDAAIAVDAVENLNSSYGYYLDESAWDNMADTFAMTSGAKEISGAGVYIGQDRIRRVLKLRGPNGGRGATSFTIHQLTQPVIHISEDGRTAKARFRLFQSGGSANGSSGSWIGGIYENTAVKENGEWKFGIQDLHHSFNASYRTGWGKMPARQGTVGSAAAAPRVLADMAPDRPIRSRQYAFPEIIEPAFHYTNPVSGRKPAELLP